MDHAFADLSLVTGKEKPAVLATVVRARGSAYRKPGASAVMTADGEILGAISGGCLEQEMLETAAEVCRSGEPRVLSYDTGSDADLLWGTGSGCGGAIDVLIAPVWDDILGFVAGKIGSGTPVAVATVIAGEGLGLRLAVSAACEQVGSLGRGSLDIAGLAAARQLLEEGSDRPVWLQFEGITEVMVQPVLPPPVLLIAGAGEDARSVAEFARQVGFRVIVADRRPIWLTPERFPGTDRLILCDGDDFPADVPLGADTYSVVMSHHFERDLGWLKRLLPSPVAYVGLLGARERSRRVVEQLRADRPDVPLSKLRAPVGLDIGAEGPQQIALSIVAEVLAIRRGKKGGALDCGQALLRR